MRIGLEILERLAKYCAESATPAGVFLYQFETISRNRLRYDPGLAATCVDPIFDDAWREWLQMVRNQVGIVDLADLVYLRSAYHVQRREARGLGDDSPTPVVLLGEKRRENRVGEPSQGTIAAAVCLAEAPGVSSCPPPQPPQ